MLAGTPSDSDKARPDDDDEEEEDDDEEEEDVDDDEDAWSAMIRPRQTMP